MGKGRQGKGWGWEGKKQRGKNPDCFYSSPGPSGRHNEAGPRREGINIPGRKRRGRVGNTWKFIKPTVRSCLLSQLAGASAKVLKQREKGGGGSNVREKTGGLRSCRRKTRRKSSLSSRSTKRIGLSRLEAKSSIGVGGQDTGPLRGERRSPTCAPKRTVNE